VRSLSLGTSQQRQKRTSTPSVVTVLFVRYADEYAITPLRVVT